MKSSPYQQAPHTAPGSAVISPHARQRGGSTASTARRPIALTVAETFMAEA
jgi:hypothetical protein